MARSGANDSSEAEEGPRGAQAAARRILIVDDDPDSGDLLALLLTHAGHSVRAVPSGADAMAEASELAPELVFLDLCLGDMSGYELAGKLRSLLGEQVLLVALTGLAGDDVLSRCRKSGIDHHILKPIDDFPSIRRLAARLEIPGPSAPG